MERCLHCQAAFAPHFPSGLVGAAQPRGLDSTGVSPLHRGFTWAYLQPALVDKVWEMNR